MWNIKQAFIDEVFPRARACNALNRPSFHDMTPGGGGGRAALVGCKHRQRSVKITT